MKDGNSIGIYVRKDEKIFEVEAEEMKYRHFK